MATEEQINLALAGWYHFHAEAREVADVYVRILKPHMRRVPFDALLTIEDENVVFEWDNYHNDGSRDGEEIRFPLAWLWTPNWEEAARAEKAIRDRELAMQREQADVQQATRNLYNARRALESALSDARAHGIIVTDA